MWRVGSQTTLYFRAGTGRVGWALAVSALHRAENDAAHEMLTALTGIGPWTADCYLLFNMRRADCFPAGDLALQEGYRLLYRKNTRPDAAQLTALAQDWSPLRGAAALVVGVLRATATKGLMAHDLASAPATCNIRYTFCCIILNR